MLTLDWHLYGANLAKIALSYLLALPTGWDRERESHSAGVRTFPIVAMASCGYLLLTPGDITAQSRVLQGLITGIGFVGAGAIVKEGMNVRGTATAASIWSTAVIGASVAMDRFEIAIVLTLLNLFTLKALMPLKKKLSGDEPESPLKP